MARILLQGFCVIGNHKIFYKNESVTHDLKIDDKVTLKISAIDFFSSEELAVAKSQQYVIECAPDQRWTDSWITCSAEGYFNLFAWLIGMRVRRAKCFCLCGTYNRNDKGAFVVGKSTTICVATDGSLSFFANDVK